MRQYDYEYNRELQAMWDAFGGPARVRAAKEPYDEMSAALDEFVRQYGEICTCAIIGSAAGINGMHCPVHDKR